MKKNNKGFTIVEILFALTLLAVGLASVVVILGEGQFQHAIAGKNIVALTLAKEKLEQIKNQTYGSVISEGIPTPVQYLDPYSEYSYRVLVTSLGGPAQIKDVAVTIFYTAAKQSTPIAITLETYIANLQ